jgi:hypothetical protein
VGVLRKKQAKSRLNGKNIKKLSFVLFIDLNLFLCLFVCYRWMKSGQKGGGGVCVFVGGRCLALLGRWKGLDI